MAGKATTNGTQALDGFLQSFKTLEPARTKGGQAWLQPVRRAAIGRLEDLGFPTMHDERGRPPWLPSGQEL